MKKVVLAGSLYQIPPRARVPSGISLSKLLDGVRIEGFLAGSGSWNSIETHDGKDAEVFVAGTGNSHSANMVERVPPVWYR